MGVTVEIGCGIASFTAAEIAPMFVMAGPNVALPTAWIGRRE